MLPVVFGILQIIINSIEHPHSDSTKKGYTSWRITLILPLPKGICIITDDPHPALLPFREKELHLSPQREKEKI
jgi:hypothetical protein